ncbi:MAG: hypothetical protein NTX91_02005 [candidate division SR1 bacterium]|nr:hypothetical protein [candidate division SR1 bacterium]
MNKKNLMLIAGLSCLLLVGCGSKSVPTSTIDTGTLFSGEQALTGTQPGENVSDQNNNVRQEVTGDTSQPTPNGTLMVSGANVKTTPTVDNSAVTGEVKALIEQRATQPKDQNKLTEDDISLIDQVIQKVQNMK